MLIGVNIQAALKEPKTGVEEYVYQLVKNLAMLEQSKKHRFVLYAPKTINSLWNLPKNFQIKKLNWPWPMWTQVRLASQLIVKKPEILFIPVHVLPRFHPKNSVVTIHGLEYEYYPEMYPKKHLNYLRLSTKYSLKRARKIIAVSLNTKKDLINLYGADENKIEVVYHGVGDEAAPLRGATEGNDAAISEKNARLLRAGRAAVCNDKYVPYILFLGRLETKKNIRGLIKAFGLLKKKYKVPHKLILSGPKGYGCQKLKTEGDIIEKGYVNNKEKWPLLSQADAFVLPSFYEGFGMPILEAQSVGCPVITSNISSMPEVAGEGAAFVAPNSVENICHMLYKVISDKKLKENLINKGYQNVKRFSWQKCAKETLKVLTEL